MDVNIVNNLFFQVQTFFFDFVEILFCNFEKTMLY